MILLVSGQGPTLRKLWGHPNLGVLLVAREWSSPPPMGLTWACDNSAFNGFDEAVYGRLLRKVEGRTDCLWVTAPDVVGDHAKTLALWDAWAPIIRAHGQRPAFVAQDGCTVENLPWQTGPEVFIGGTTRYKLGPEAARIVREARERGVWTHMGRVNTFRRLQYAHTLGVDSVDGSKYSKWSETHVPGALAYLAQLDRQRAVFGPAIHSS